jgi:hypothetical protein
MEKSIGDLKRRLSERLAAPAEEFCDCSAVNI